jgi:predicted glycosyltransferase
LRILIDIGHPAHVHYFRNFIAEMQLRGHQFLITARDKEVTLDLLQRYNIPFHGRGKGGNGMLAKLAYMLYADIFLFRKALKFKPDLFLSFASTYAAHASFLCRKPHIALDDTEHARFELFLYTPFTQVILTPDCFTGELGKKQIRIRAFAEFLYLHRNRFCPDHSVRSFLNISPDEKLVLLRFISWKASHDIGQRGIPDNEKRLLVSRFKELGYAVRISAEGDLLPDLEPYRLKLPSDRIHDLIATSDLFIGESGTMSTEACLLGTPAFFVNSLDAGVFQEEVKRGLLWHFKSGDGVCNKIIACIQQPRFRDQHQKAVADLHASKIDFTAFLLWFCENYPQSQIDIKKNPEIFNQFL